MRKKCAETTWKRGVRPSLILIFLSDLFDLCLQATELESKIKVTNSKRK